MSRSVTPRWPWLTACLQRSAGGRLLSLRIWSTHMLRGRPGWRNHWLFGGWPSDRLIWLLNALWAGTSSASLATWPKRPLRWPLMVSEMKGRPVVVGISRFWMNWCHLICSKVFDISYGKPQGLLCRWRGESKFHLHITIQTAQEPGKYEF